LGKIQKRFEDQVIAIANAIANFPRDRNLLVASHIDADGITSAGIISTVLSDLHVPFHLTFFKQMLTDDVKAVVSKGYDSVLLMDFGTSHIEYLDRVAEEDLEVYIVDHHQPTLEYEPRHIFILNPYFHGLDGSREISTSGLAYLIAKKIGGYEHLLPIAIAGAIGDRQHEGGFHGLNRELLKYAVDSGLVNVVSEVNLFGGPKHPLLFALERTVDPYIPGITSDQSACFEFLTNIGIEPMKQGAWVTLRDLDERKKRILVSELVKRIASESGKASAARKLIGEIYYWNFEDDTSPIKDLRDFSTILNACGRMGYGGFGVALCMGYRGWYLAQALKVYQEYRQNISSAIKNILSNFKERVRVHNGLAFISGEDIIQDTMIGTITSILLGLKEFEQVEIAIGFSKVNNNFLKVSGRAKANMGLNLGKVMSEISVNLEGEGGGHRLAAGCTIPVKHKDKFIRELSARLSTR